MRGKKLNYGLFEISYSCAQHRLSFINHQYNEDDDLLGRSCDGRPGTCWSNPSHSHARDSWMRSPPFLLCDGCSVLSQPIYRTPLSDMTRVFEMDAVLPTKNLPNRGASTSETVAHGSQVAQVLVSPLKLH